MTTATATNSGIGRTTPTGTVVGSVAPLARRSAIVGGLAGILVVGLLASAGAAGADDHTEPSLVVDLDAAGDAEVTLTLVFDLDDADERQAFEALEGDADVREEFRERFEDRTATVAEEASEATGREMAVSEAEIDLESNDRRGVVELSVEWEALAAVEGETVTVTEPFASGFAPEQRFEIVGPDGYAVTDVSPAADDRGDDRLGWDAGTTIEGTNVTFVADGANTTPEAESELDAEDQPGFGVVASLGALLAVLFARRARRPE